MDNLHESELVYASKNDEQEFEELLKIYDPIIHILSKRYFSNWLTYDDFLQYARIGLWEAVINYDLSLNVSFRFFAIMIIKRKLITLLKYSNRKKFRYHNESISCIRHKKNNEEWYIDDFVPSSDNAEEIVIQNDQYKLLLNLIRDIFVNEWTSYNEYNRKWLYKPVRSQLIILREFLEGAIDCNRDMYSIISINTGLNNKCIDNIIQKIRHKANKYIKINNISILDFTS